MARVLFLTQVLPYPLDCGAKTRQYHMLRHLAQSHEVTLVSFIRPDDKPESIVHLETCCHAVHTVPIQRSLWRNLRAGAKGMMTGMPIVIARDEMEAMTATLRSLVQENSYAVIHADQLSMAGYGQVAAAFSHTPRPQTLLDEHNAIYLLTKRMAETETRWLRRQVMTREAHAFARYETRMCQAYDAVLTVIAEDKERLLALLPPDTQESTSQKFTVVPICVDPAEVAPISHEAGHPPTILHLGTMFWPPNISGVLWFAQEVLPLIQAEMPEARFVVVGKNPPDEVKALAADPRVEVTGYVAELSPYLTSADAFVVPLHAGGGMRVKILDAWMWGLPIVATPIGAEGIEVQDGDNILLAGDALSFAKATLQVLNDEALNNRLRAQGRRWVENHYGWHEVYRKVDDAYAKLLRGDQ